MINCIVIMGRLTADPELKKTNSGNSVCSFSVAVERNYKGRNGEAETDFFNVTAWRGTADFVHKYFRKGQMIAVQGEMQSRRYTDKDGNNRIAWEIKPDIVSFCGDKSGSSANDNKLSQTANVDIEPEQDELLPF